MRVIPVVLQCSTGEEVRYSATEKSPFLFSHKLGNTVYQAIVLVLDDWNKKTGYDSSYNPKYHESYNG